MMFGWWRKCKSLETHLEKTEVRLYALERDAKWQKKENRSKEAEIQLHENTMFLPSVPGKKVVKAYAWSVDEFFYFYQDDVSPQPEAMTTKTKKKDTPK